jgi:arylsulfatase A-like enzyme
VAGVEPPEDIDGISYLPELLGQTKAQRKHDYLYWPGAIRVGKWKLHRHGKDRFALYDLEHDIAEKNDLAEKFPELVTRYRRYFDEARKR